MKASALVLLSFLLLAPGLPNGYSQNGENRYPNELPAYRFYTTAKWKSLEPFTSTIADARRQLVSFQCCVEGIVLEDGNPFPKAAFQRGIIANLSSECSAKR